MTITAKYPGTCPTCQSPITPGQKVEWAKGSKARHTDCGAAPQASAPVRAASEPRRPTTDQPATEKQISYALRLLARLDFPLIADAFTPPTPAQVERMSRDEISGLIDMLRMDEDEW